MCVPGFRTGLELRPRGGGLGPLPAALWPRRPVPRGFSLFHSSDWTRGTWVITDKWPWAQAFEVWVRLGLPSLLQARPSPRHCLLP